MHGGKVPMFKMKAQSGPLWLAVVVLVLGCAAYFDGHKDLGDIDAHGRGDALLAISIAVSGVLVIVATGRMWFKHLWHDRYGRR